MANPFGRSVVLPLTNQSGGSVAAGDLVYLDTGHNDAFVTGTTGAYTGAIGIAQQAIGAGSVGLVLVQGYAALVNVNASVTRGNFGKGHTVAKQATDAGSSRIAGTFCQFLTGGTTPDAMIWQPDLGGGSGLSDPMTTRGDIIVRNASNVTARLPIGSNGKALMSDGTDIAWTTLPAGGAPLGVTAYAPSGDNTYSITATSDADVDATNLQCVAVVPASGKVIVCLSALANDGNNNFHWTVRVASSTLGDAYVSSQVNKAMRFAARIYLTGLTPGSTTFKWGAYVNGGTGSIHYGSTSSKFGAALMEVWGA